MTTVESKPQESITERQHIKKEQVKLSLFVDGKT